MGQFKNKTIYIFVFIFLMFSNLLGQTKDAPANIAATMVVKVAGFEKNISSGGDISVYVLGASDIAAELKKVIGSAIGQATLKSVDSGSDLPANKPTILFLGDESKLDATLEYTHGNQVLSATAKPDLVSKGVTLGFGIGADNKPKIMLNLKGSSAEGRDWNQAILKVAQTI